MRNLTDKTVLITGASSGIGAACAKQFAALGANLILCARRLERLQTLASELINQNQVKVYTIPLDVSDQKRVEAAIAELPSAWQKIDILVNNAGLALGRELISEARVVDWERMIDTNLKGMLYVTRQLVPGMVKRKMGHIINIGSIAGRQVYRGGNVYCATKHALRALTEGLRLELFDKNIKVSEIAPGMVETEFSMVRFAGDEERAKQVYTGLMPLTADDVADAVIYCATRPAHVNVGDMLLLPTHQASITDVYRSSDS
jgi:serine 3-dehydrogenase